MKNITLALLIIAATLVASSCHYGEEEAAKTLDRNELYKGDKAEFSVNRAGEGATSTPSTDETTHDVASGGEVPADSTAAKK